MVKYSLIMTRRNYQLFQGNNRFYCCGQCVSANQCSISPAQHPPNWYRSDILRHSFLGLFYSLSFILKTGCTDPGIIPRARPDEIDYMISLGKLVTENQQLAEFIGNPTLNKMQKEGALREVLKAKKFSDLTVNLFGTLAENSRLNRAQGVVKAYMTIMSAYRGEVPCTVTTATPMNTEMKKQLEKTLQGFLEKNQVLKLDVQQDPEILGGMVVDLGDKFIDMSTKTKVQKIVKTIGQGM